MRRLSFVRDVLGTIGALFLFFILGGLITSLVNSYADEDIKVELPVTYAEEPCVPVVEEVRTYWLIPDAPEYKKQRMIYAQDLAEEKGLGEYRLDLVAQIHRENGAWTEDRRGDGGCSVGLTQWNECARGPVPEKSWQGQIRLLYDEMLEKSQDFDIFAQNQVSWNCPRCAYSGSYKTKYYYDLQKMKEMFKEVEVKKN